MAEVEELPELYRKKAREYRGILQQGEAYLATGSKSHILWGMDYLDRSTGFDIEELLEESSEKEQQRLEKERERMEEQLEQRVEVHEEIVDELESKLDWYKERLESLYKQRRGRNSKREQSKQQIS
ncbi:hypothetical protein [Halorhabdus amylolytica]|uniref:hypothetical protein n=1 Tax=Halorhabdus amylolytica TaxID=2559573 RepID=UPI0010AAD943|nr:hypothetical protein [Halorhabdus amylolytica]